MDIEMDKGMVGVLRESSIRVGVAPHPPLPNQMNSSVIVGKQPESIGVLPRQERLSRTTSFRKLPRMGCACIPFGYDKET